MINISDQSKTVTERYKIFKTILKNKLTGSQKASLNKYINLVKYFGFNYRCPICNYYCKEFLPFGIELDVIVKKEIIGAGLRNSVCVKCGSRDRERLVYLYLKKVLRIEHKSSIKNILHIAPEPRLSKFIMNIKDKNYICGDLISEGYNYPDYVQELDVTNLPFDDSYFDLIICNHVLEHIENDSDAMKELFRVLNKNGVSILQVPISKKINKTFENPKITNPKDREIYFGQYDHVRIYGMDYKKRLESVGFLVEESNLASEWSYYGTNIDEPLFVAKKNI